ncbi:MAG: YciI family protein [Gemmatimonadota bacterium]
MYALILIRYRRPLDEIEAGTGAHREYLRGLKEAGLLLASGPFDPRVGGAVLLRLPEGDPEALDRIRDQDPFYRAGLANYELLPWRPTIGSEALDRL